MTFPLSAEFSLSPMMVAADKIISTRANRSCHDLVSAYYRISKRRTAGCVIRRKRKKEKRNKKENRE
jgi:hypothetical protein